MAPTRSPAAPQPPDPLVADLLARCTFPPPGPPLACAVSGGADSLALLVLAAPPVARSPPSTSTTGCAPGSAREADVVAARGRASGPASRPTG